MRIFQVKSVARFTRSERITDASLAEAVERAGRGLVDADLGGGLIKQRVARAGQGARGGYRMLIGFRMRDRAVFVFGFAKSDIANVTDNEVVSLRQTALAWLAADETTIKLAVEGKFLQEVRI